MKLLAVYLLPVYLATWLWVRRTPDHSWEVLLHLSYVLLLGLSLGWGIVKSSPDPLERLAPASVQCPACGQWNPPVRVLCQACLEDLYTFDEAGNLTAIIPSTCEPTAT